ncbi:beta-propeller fold lactonase family protein (plasmid) [Ralstonia sp. R-29]|uniref:beta-propeller fold lactonase family protein n=1 Tax=Ralstonia sp. R-29 TaxID=3404059 RepID=UPI003CEE4D50
MLAIRIYCVNRDVSLSVMEDPTNRFVIVGNYATGSVVSLPIQADASLGRVSDLVELPGKPGAASYAASRFPPARCAV